jgi:hypothetical protein
VSRHPYKSTAIVTITAVAIWLLVHFADHNMANIGTLTIIMLCLVVAVYKFDRQALRADELHIRLLASQEREEHYLIQQQKLEAGE